jgi:crotonobetainyl-CoA:carnitine CoA-transferase CaiB-like acyl-CoA transferase
MDNNLTDFLENQLFNAKVPVSSSMIMITPYGVFKTDDGKLTVYDYDDDGNWYDIPQAEQDRRVDLWKKRLAAEAV